MIYMKSVSGDDGSYTLTVLVRARHRSRHQHRQRQQPGADRAVQPAAPTCSARASRSRRSRPRCSASSPSIRRSTRHDPLFLSNYVTINLLDQIKSTPGVGDAYLVGAAGLRDARLGPDRPADRPQPDHRRHHQRDPVAERPGRGRPHRRAADLERPAAAAQHPDQGPADLGRGFREHRHPHQSGRLGAAARRRRAARARRRQSRPRDAVQRRPGRRDRDLPVAGRQRDRHPQGGARQARRSCRSAFPRIWPGRSPTTRPCSSPIRSTRCRRR